MAKLEKEVPSIFVGSLEDFLSLMKSGFKDVGTEADFQKACEVDADRMCDECLCCSCSEKSMLECCRNICLECAKHTASSTEHCTNYKHIACDESEDDERCIACGNLLPASAETSYCYICVKNGVRDRMEALYCDNAKLGSQLEMANARVKELMGGLDWASNLLEDAEAIMDKLTAKIEKRDTKIAKLKKRLRGQAPTEVAL